MGEILFRTRLSEQMFTGLAPWLERVPGRLMHTDILGCGIFAAVSGSSAATCATIAKMALPELQARGYAEGITLGSLAERGHARHPDPAVDHMIVYARRGRSVDRPQLFIAGVHSRLPADAAVLGLHRVVGACCNPRAHAAAGAADHVRAEARRIAAS